MVSLAKVDFIPRCVSSGGIFSESEFERFDALIRRANNWLRSNPHIRVKTVESIEIKRKSMDEDINPDRATYTTHGNLYMRYIRALRLWIAQRDENDPPEPQQIAHFNVVPLPRGDGGFFGKPKFESYDQTIERVNAQLRRNPLPGKVINLETQDMKYHTSIGGVDPDETYWRESKEGIYFINILRIFYEVGPPRHEEIGDGGQLGLIPGINHVSKLAELHPKQGNYQTHVDPKLLQSIQNEAHTCFADFKPALLDDGGIVGQAKFERFCAVVSHAAQWIAQHPQLQIVSVQSCNYKVKYINDVDTHRTTFYAQGEAYTYFLRIIRVGYVFSAIPANFEHGERQPGTLTYKTFRPCLLSNNVFSNNYETIDQTVTRAIHWLRHSGAKVISAETVPVRLDGGHQHGDPGVTYTRLRGNEPDAKWLYVVRCYFSNRYTEPPAQVLQPLPERRQEEEDCCVIL